MCKAVFRCYDAKEYELSYGDEQTLKGVMNALIDQGICQQDSFVQMSEE